METEVDCIKQIQKKNTDLVNESIPYGDLLVIDENGGKVGIISRREALAMAAQKELDVVVVSPDSKPMVAKFMDYSKYRFEQQKKLKEIKKNQHIVELKEIRLSPTIDKHDLETKLKHAIKFLEKGDKVKLSIRFYGRMITHSEVGRQVMMSFIEAVGSKAIIESKPKMDGRSLIAILAPIITT
ncbi:MAG: translation initiation factor IF-3 [Acholeplasmataceae bacterium]|nr:translation initiation factor IF-3 [Acholeplasmataceae bacterium]